MNKRARLVLFFIIAVFAIAAIAADLITYKSPVSGSNEAVRGHDGMLWIDKRDLVQAYAQIFNAYGDVVRTSNKSLLKFGASTDIDGSFETVWMYTGATDETYISTNGIDKLSSSDAGDTVEICYEGHTISGSDLTFVSDCVTLAGQTETSLPTPVARISRAYNNSSTELVGTVYFYEDDTVSGGVPQTAANVHMVIAAGYQQTRKAARSFASTEYCIMSEMYGGIGSGGGGTRVEFVLEVRLSGGVFREQFTVATNDNFVKTFSPYFIIPKNSDIRIRAASSGNNTDVHAGFNCYLTQTIE